MYSVGGLIDIDVVDELQLIFQHEIHPDLSVIQL